jgi:2-oxoglutarate dehydrogenase E1 component
MGRTTFAGRWNLAAIDSAYESWRRDPESVEASWRVFFEGFELGAERRSDGPSVDRGQSSVIRLINGYRRLGHLLARLDPLSDPPASIPLLELSEFGWSEADLDRTIDAGYFLGLGKCTLRELLTALRDTYCRTIGVEYMHIQDSRIRLWLQQRMEPCRNRPVYSRRQKIRILINLHFAELFEKFLQSSYVGQKRFSLEGAETLIPLLDSLVENAADRGAKEIVLGMAHRGRLNVLANILGKPFSEIFNEFDEHFLPDSRAGDGDVKYHLGFSSDRTTSQGKQIHLSLTPNPSHLEAVNPVVEGRVRAKQMQFGDSERTLGMPLLIHGDAAFAGQGLVAETLNLSQLAGFRTGGTIHIVVNNQIGFTTSPKDARSTAYCTDVAKMIEVPIFHVNAEDPEAAIFVAELALEFRQTFHKDVVIDMYCYRRHGHNEGDEPSFTQPIMYAKIKEHPTLSDVFTERLILNGDLTVEETEAIVHEFQGRLQAARAELKRSYKPPHFGMKGYSGRWKDLSPNYEATPVETRVPFERLRTVAEGLARLPESFTLHPKMVQLIEHRRDTVSNRQPIDWGLAEALAFGSLLLEGTSVRLSGQDSRRGTFSQRHAVLHDIKTGEPYFPLDHLDPGQARFFIYDSLLSEAAVLGFEFGYSLETPDAFVAWEAQFGDFANGAQVIIDQFITCSQSKWQRDSGLVMLLPHGYEGQGPEHSSARLERYLQMCAEDNIQVCYPTTPAQYFHLLRRQVRRRFRRPLIIMTPKSLLRHKQCVSPIDAFTSGSFQEILDDTSADPERVRRVILCSGKVYYDLVGKAGTNDGVAIVRIEQFYPLPADSLQRTLRRYRASREWVWVQEESMNMGGWSYMEPRFKALGFEFKYIGRDSSASPATGWHKVHQREQRELVEAALFGAAPHLVRGIPTAPVAAFAERAPEQLDLQPKMNG